MYICNTCKSRFDEPNKENITFEDYYGVGNLFASRTRTTLDVCPYCDDDDIEELEQCEICEEWFRSEDLTDTEGMVGGNVGYACPQCLEDCDIGW